ncbi:hypothetical protein [Clostridium sp. JS66]|uniref:hypothetical protein n=1 Tax=Clostridium sp. JS66 TaxID=3064705 RepID=UPI00298DDB38|nr:hypothetical protein [Clostridium sp. JS66]WPC43891.1 hypothetical protein Q6H37_10560 [Clostridium sp. JS66]
MNNIKDKLFRIIAIILNTIYVIAIVPVGFAFLVAGAMIFDTPKSAGDPRAWLFFFLTLSIPVVMFLACVSSIILVSKKSNTKAFLCSISPIAYISIIVLINWLFTTIKG